MFVIIHNNQVIMGPKKWNKLHFEEVLAEECGVSYTLPTKNDDNQVFVVDGNTSIMPVASQPLPSYNAKIERLEGPWWTFSSSYAEMSYTVERLSLDAIRNQLKAIVANNRYLYETTPAKVTIQTQQVTVDMSRGSRDIFLQTWLTMGDTEVIRWKFPEAWIQVTKEDIGVCVSTGKAQIQTCFDWENQKHEEIDAASTYEELDAIKLEMENI